MARAAQGTRASRARLSGAGAPLRRAVLRTPWLGPREVAESAPWPLLRLGGNHPSPLPPHIVAAAHRAAADAPYPPTRGLRQLRQAIAERVSAELGTPVDPEREVLVTCGSMQALYLAAVVATGRGLTAVAPAPSFFYSDLVALAGGQLHWVPGQARPDWAALARAMDPSVSLVFVNTPCNPTGHVYDEADLVGLARAVTGRRCWIVSDEALSSYVYDGMRHLSPAVLPELRSRTVVLRSFSKMYSMGPWRVGFAVGPKRIIGAMARLLQWSVIGVDSVAQSAALAALTGPQAWARQLVAELEDIRLRAARALNRGPHLRAEVPAAGAVLWARLPSDADERAAASRLGREHGIPAVSGQLFGAVHPHLRIPFGGYPDDVEELVRRLPAVTLEEA